MNIAVLTMTISTNYGGTLQAYALMEILKKLGHEPELIFVQLEDKNVVSQLKKYLSIYILSYLSKKWSYNKITPIKKQNTNYFISKYINPKTKAIYTENDFAKIVKDKYDAYIAGSDQVWRPGMYKFINYAFFDFVKNPNAILLSYAASFGVDVWEYTEEQTKKFKEQIERFRAISVREDSGIRLCEKHFGVHAEHVLDPTMLLSVDDYRKIIHKEKEQSHEGELLTYILDQTDEKVELINLVSQEFGIKPYTINVKSTDINANINDQIYPAITSWLKGFDDAKYVITDSFHGCVFSILFNKPFIVYGNKKRGMARFNSLLQLFDLQDRLILSIHKFDDSLLGKEIDWNHVNKKLDEMKNYSINFLISNLQGLK